jgi:hypothetical protein
LEQQSGRRVEQGWEHTHRGQVAREVRVIKGRHDDKRGDEQGHDHPRTKKCIALAGFILVLFCNAPLASFAQDGDGGGHVLI